MGSYEITVKAHRLSVLLVVGRGVFVLIGVFFYLLSFGVVAVVVLVVSYVVGFYGNLARLPICGWSLMPTASSTGSDLLLAHRLL